MALTSPCSYNDIAAYARVEQFRSFSTQFADLSEQAQKTCDPVGNTQCAMIVVEATSKAWDAKDRALAEWGTISQECRDYIRSHR